MISRPTVLVLGAGASAPFGFPLGRQLVMEIVSKLRSQGDPLSTMLNHCGHEWGRIERFRADLERSSQPSVDLFLESRPDLLGIGKSAIAAALIPRENEGRLIQKSDTPSWYEHLWGAMKAKRDEFLQNQLAIITFNYDRSLEHFLYLGLKHTFDLDESAVSALLKSVPIVHVHGALGDHPALSGNGRPYEPQATPEAVKRCAEGIKVVHEGASQELEFQHAAELLRKSSAICFLGFGYHAENISRLMLPDLLDGKEVFGSGDEVSPVERQRAQAKIGCPLSWGLEHQDILEFLRRFPVLL